MSADKTPAADGHPPAAGDARSGTTAPAGRRFWTLTLGCIGVVYGDIGTSPLYAMREALAHAADDGVTREEVLGVASLLLWALILIVTVKYVLFIMRADNRGEGGTLSLMALAQTGMGRRSAGVFVLGIAGAALFYGDALITPAISVLSAVEGLKIVTPVFDPYVLPIALVILVGLFAVQRRGTEAVAAWFGPITVVWFVAMSATGILHLGDDPEILAAFNPLHALRFVGEHGLIGFIVLGSVFLAVTGVEALYADMGHFGRGPIRFAWLWFVFPALALNYLGQGAFVLANPEGMANPFFLMCPEWALIPMVVLATMATVIASQAVISGAFSLTRQAIQLGLLPRFEIRHTSETEAGQIYMPRVNFLLLGGVLLLAVLFKSSSALASAYGIAVTGTMVVTTCLAFVVAWKCWHWPLWLAALVCGAFLAIDTAFLLANLLKFLDGGYVPLLLAGFLMVAMWTWTRGTRILFEKTHRASVALADLASLLARSPPHRSPGTAVFLTSDPDMAPMALMHNLKHNKVLHEANVILTVRTDTAPRIDPEQRIRIETVDPNFTRIALTFGYMETPHVPAALAQCRKRGLRFDIMSTSFFLGRRSVKPAADAGMPLWQDMLYVWMMRGAANATDYYHIPPGRVVEMGQQITV